jgi:hypothetical protein
MEEQIVYVPLDENNEISEELQLEIINEYQFVNDLKNELWEPLKTRKYYHMYCFFNFHVNLFLKLFQ